MAYEAFSCLLLFPVLHWKVGALQQVLSSFYVCTNTLQGVFGMAY